MFSFEFWFPSGSKQRIFNHFKMLLDAVTRGRIYQVKFLLDTETDDVNKTDENKQTALMKAVFLDDSMRCTRQKIARVLLASGAKVNMVDREGKTALIWACIKGRQGIVRTLLEKSVIDLDINGADEAGNTALFYAASGGHTKIVQMLVKVMLRFGLDIDKRNARGMTPILEATKRGHDFCAQVLMTEGQASLTIRDPQTFLNTREWAEKCSLVHLSEMIARRAPSPLMVLQNIDGEDGEDTPQIVTQGINSPHPCPTKEGARLPSGSRHQSKTTENGISMTKSPSMDRVDKECQEPQSPSHALSTHKTHSEKNTESQKEGRVDSKVSLKRRKSAQIEKEKQMQPLTAKSEMCRLLGLYGIQHSDSFRPGFDPISLPPSGFWPDPLAHLRDNMSIVSSEDLESLSEFKPRMSINRRRSSAVPGMQEPGSARRGSNMNFLRENRRSTLVPGSNLSSSFGRRVSNIPASSSSGLKSFLELPGRRTSLMPQGERNRRPQVSRRVTAVGTIQG